MLALRSGCGGTCTRKQRYCYSRYCRYLRVQKDANEDQRSLIWCVCCAAVILARRPLCFFFLFLSLSSFSFFLLSQFPILRFTKSEFVTCSIRAKRETTCRSVRAVTMVRTRRHTDAQITLPHNAIANHSLCVHLRVCVCLCVLCVMPRSANPRADCLRGHQDLASVRYHEEG